MISLLLRPTKEKHVTYLFGTSGYVGKATVKYLSKTVGKHARIMAGSRDPEKLKNELGKLTGVEYRQSDMSKDPEEMAKDLEGVHTAFIITPGPTE